MKHLTYVERRWLVWDFQGQPTTDPSGERSDGRLFVDPVESLDEVVRDLRAQGGFSRAIMESHDLSEVGQPSERWGRRIRAGQLRLRPGRDPARLDVALSGRSQRDRQQIVGSVLTAADLVVELQRQQAWEQPYAPGPAWAWGSNGRLLNNLVVLGAAYELAGSSALLEAVRTGIDYLFGRNALGQSYVAGYGVDFTRHQRTRHFAHDRDPAFPPPPRGSLAGGRTNQAYPDFPDDPRLPGLPPQCAYRDEPRSETTNDVCIRWNAPLVGRHVPDGQRVGPLGSGGEVT